MTSPYREQSVQAKVDNLYKEHGRLAMEVTEVKVKVRNNNLAIASNVIGYIAGCIGALCLSISLYFVFPSSTDQCKVTQSDTVDYYLKQVLEWGSDQQIWFVKEVNK